MERWPKWDMGLYAELDAECKRNHNLYKPKTKHGPQRHISVMICPSKKVETGLPPLQGSDLGCLLFLHLWCPSYSGSWNHGLNDL